MTTDAEKAAILLRITAELAQPFCREERMHGGWTMLFQHGQPATQFIPSELAERIGAPLKAGDVVRCATNPRHRWGVAEYVEPLDDGAVLRELGGGPLLAMRNESFYVLRFYPPEILFYGHKRRVYDWARGKAFRRAADDPWATKCGGVEMSDDTLSVWVRPHMWFSERRQKDGPTLYAQPRRIDMPWTNRTRLKDIVRALLDGGINEEFEFSPEEPTKGMRGCAKFTRADVEQAMAGTQ